MTDRHRTGDIVVLKPQHAEDSWRGLSTGVILGRGVDGYGSEYGDANSGNWKVRWDGYNYGTDPKNCHTVSDAILMDDAPDEQELAQALASIEKAARNTMPKEAAS